MKGLITLALLLALLHACAAFSPSPLQIEVSQYFTASTNSTCGDPPTLFEEPQNPGVLLNCTSGDHDAELALDGDLDTWWQSENGVTPVSITFTLQEVS